MFTVALRRQSPALIRLTSSSIRALTSSPSSSNSTIVRAAPLKTAVLSSSPSQRRFFAISAYLRDEANANANATAEAEAIVDSDPPAGEYAHAGHGHEHHFAKEEPITKFQQLADKGLVDSSIINTITKGLGYEEMTKVQRKTILETVNGENVLAQAKTGTGKTIAFLLPVLQRVLTSQKPLKTVGRYSRERTSPGESNSDIRAIIVSPTRELATQIAVDAQKLTANTPIVVQTAVGGSGKSDSLRSIHKYGCHILIATPGRLLDLLTDPRGVTAPNLEIFVMDEADNLLDVGFAKELDNIMAALPPRHHIIEATGRARQTLLFSATVPDKVMSVVKKTMGSEYKFLRMVEKGEAQTHEKVEQRVIRAKGLENLIPAVYELCERERAVHNSAMNAESEEENLPFKAIIFFSATRWTSLAAETFRQIRGQNGAEHPLAPTRIFEIHSRLTQGQRDTAAKRFRNAESAILFSSDVTARGMDFPKVTHVIQIGGPKNKEQYIHRLGRTARGSREGVGYLILPDMEYAYTMQELKGLPFIEEEEIATARIDLGAEQTLPKSTADILTTLTEASMRVPREFKSRTYTALIGIYTAIGDKRGMIQGLNRLATLGWGMEEPPYVSPLLAQKMGLERVPGLNTTNKRDDEFGDEGSDRPHYDSSRGGSSSRGGFGGRGGRGGFGSSGGRGGGFSSRGRDGESGGFGGRSSFSSRGGGRDGESSGFGGRGSFSSRGGGRDGESSGFGGRSSFGNRDGGRDSESGESGGRSSFGNRDGGRDSESGGFGGRSSFGGRDGESSRGRGGYSSGGRGGFSSRGRDSESGGFGRRDSGGGSRPWEGRGQQGGGRGRGGFSRGGFSSGGRDGESGGFGGSRGGFGGRGRGRGGDSFGGGERKSFGDRDSGSQGFGGDRPSRGRGGGGRSGGMSRFDSE